MLKRCLDKLKKKLGETEAQVRSGFNQDGIGQVLSYTLSLQSVFSGNSIWFLLLLIYHSRVISKPDQLAKLPLYQHKLIAYESVSPCLIG